jgi:hypothetical protein
VVGYPVTVPGKFYTSPPVNGAEVGTIFAIANAGTTSADKGTGTVVYDDKAHQHGPMGLVLAPNGDLITANSDGVNVDPKQPSTLVELTTGGEFVSQFSIDPSNGGAFRLTASATNDRLQLAAVNDNQSTVSVWTFQSGIPFPPK